MTVRWRRVGASVALAVALVTVGYGTASSGEVDVGVVARAPGAAWSSAGGGSGPAAEPGRQGGVVEESRAVGERGALGGPDDGAGRELAHGSYHAASITDPAARRRCVAAVARARGPLLAVVGASFAAGVGARTPAAAWAVDLAHRLRWRALVVGVPGVGYVHVGEDRIGPLARVTAALHLGTLRPTLVVVQAGHDDWRSPARVERRAAGSYYTWLHRSLPRARIGVVTVFASPHAPAQAMERLGALDASIVGALRAAAPAAIVMDPLVHHWRFDRSIPGRLHPSARGDGQLASRILSGLERHRVRPAPPRSVAHPVCSLVIPQVLAGTRRHPSRPEPPWGSPRVPSASPGSGGPPE